MKLSIIQILLVPLLLGATPAGDESTRVFLIGDSTMSEKEMIGAAERGWGQAFALHFTDTAMVRNHARNGRSTKSFLNEGRWEAVLHSLRAGDYVLMQFGHNDAKENDSTRYAPPHTTYREILRRFIHETRSKNATPVLITPVCRRRFDASGKFYDVHGEYPGVVRELGKEENVTVVDLNTQSSELFAGLGLERSKSLFLHTMPGEHSAYVEGKKDDTHFNPYGAAEIARLVVMALRQHEHPLTQHLSNSEPVFSGVGKKVLLDCFYNNEWRPSPTGMLERYHYVWQDTTNSGFSTLGRIITDTGATIDTLCRKPTTENLRHSDVYIIVDPDTPKETANPNFLDTPEIDAIAGWVRNGGVLLLMGNDKENAEFEHFNKLAGRFGMQFNEDRRNPATSKDFSKATFETFPDHAMFKDVRRVFIKELSTLSITPPARALFTDGNDVIIAFAQYGSGSVLAVGDPWFYNEYMGTWRLPEGYDNSTAARNIFAWLFGGTWRSEKQK